MHVGVLQEPCVVSWEFVPMAPGEAGRMRSADPGEYVDPWARTDDWPIRRARMEWEDVAPFSAGGPDIMQGLGPVEWG